MTTAVPPEPPTNCVLCPRLVDYRADNRRSQPDWHNAPVSSFGDDNARLLIVGLAPGVSGANKTGRPFTGDFAGDLLYETLAKFGFSSGTYAAHPDDGVSLTDCMITNAVRCVPPQNKPVGSEINTCRDFLSARIQALPNLVAILALGKIAHDSVLKVFSLRLAEFRFTHGGQHNVAEGLTLFDSYHCSRYNTNTGRLTPEMFHDVFGAMRNHLDA